MPKKYGEFFPTLFVKTTDYQFVFNFEQTRTVTIFGEGEIVTALNQQHIPIYTVGQIIGIGLKGQ